MTDFLTQMAYGPGSESFIAKVVLMPKNIGEPSPGDQGIAIFGAMFPSEAGAKPLVINDCTQGVGKEFHHERWDGQLILVPKFKRYTNQFHGMRADQVLCDGFGDDARWESPYWSDPGL